MLQKIINENLYNKKANIPVMEEQEIINDYNQIERTKGFQQIKKIVESYGYELDEAYIEEYGKNKRRRTTIQFRNNSYNNFKPEIRYDRNSNKFQIGTAGYGYLNLKDIETFSDNLDNAYQLCKKLEKIDLLNILPIIVEKE